MQQDSSYISTVQSADRSTLISEFIARTLCAAIMGIFVWRTFDNYRATQDTSLLILFINELFTFGLVVFARIPRHANRSPLAWLLVLVSIFYALLIDLSVTQTSQLMPLAVTIPIQTVGFVWQVSTKIWLGRSFGLLPENRGVVTTGPYRLVRHPIYFGYLLNHIGFVLSHFSVWNVLVLAVLYSCQVLRMKEEEKVLQSSPEYKQYMQHIRYRLVPFLY